MTDIRFAAGGRSLVRGARSLLVVAPAARFSKLPEVLTSDLRALAADLASDLDPGDSGATASTLTGGTAPRALVACVLPDTVSRHNCPARAEAIRHVVREACARARGKTAVLLVLDEAGHGPAAVQAVGRALPLFSRKGGGKPARFQVLAVDPGGGALPPSAALRATLDSARQAARLVDTPASELHPAALAREARALLRGIRGVRIREIAGKDLLAHRLGGIHGVGRCALEPPRLLVATWAPPRGGGTHVALVGKGVTFDTGGLNLKTGGFMLGMKTDMGGAAAVLGAFRVLTATGCKHRLSLVLAIAENAVGPAALKPDDILTMHSGKTVEINNTDAEGRLLLADGVSWAARRLEADCVLDAATLTGAQLVSTGLLHAAVVSNDAVLEDLVVAAGRASGDLCHPLIFAPELFRKEFRSEVADMKNSVKDRKNAQSSCAAQFVYDHIDDTGVRWCHVDLAGPARMHERGTGFGVALLAEAVRRL